MFVEIALATSFALQVSAFPWVARHVGRDPVEMMGADGLVRRIPGDAASCPNNPNHVPAAPITAKYPYCGAINGASGYQVCVNNLVPAKGDDAHKFIAPDPNKDTRGPCPGLNTAANHGFLARDGITIFAELTDAQQNAYGVGYDLAVLLAVLGVGLDGDPFTTKLSIGCDATTRTATPGLGPELGLDGHDKFEGDTSLTRNNYFTAGGDNFKFNKTLYQENGNFYFGPESILLYGAASFLYELFPSFGDQGPADQPTMHSCFIKQTFPPNWFTRVRPYTTPDVAGEIFKQYELYPVAFGGKIRKPNSFVGVGRYGPYFSNNTFNGMAQGVACLIYQLATENDPSAFGGGGSTTPVSNYQFAASKLNPIYSNGTLASYNCPLAYNDA